MYCGKVSGIDHINNLVSTCGPKRKHTCKLKKENLIILLQTGQTQMFLSTIKWLTNKKCFLILYHLKISEWIWLKLQHTVQNVHKLE